MLPSEEQAIQFAMMLQAGLPAADAIMYFADSEVASKPEELNALMRKWVNSRAVRKATLTLMGKAWQNMNLEERAKYALDLHYSQLAYLLYSNHYAEANSTDKGKLDTARQSLEAKLAGNAGKTDALSQFLADVKSGTVKLNRPLAN